MLILGVAVPVSIKIMPVYLITKNTKGTKTIDGNTIAVLCTYGFHKRIVQQ
jgi:hypothetical protein